MNRENNRPGAGRILAGYLAGVALAVLSPIMLITEIMSLMVVVMIPAVAMVLINRWCGRAPALCSGLLQLVVHAQWLGSAFMWMAFFTTVLPTFILLSSEKRPFYTQIKVSISAFGLGVLLAVAALYFSYGGNMVERMLQELPNALRSLPRESLEVMTESFSAMSGTAVTVEDFYALFDRLIAALIPIYQIQLPGLIFSGALITAAICVGLNARLRHKQGIAGAGEYLPLREWFLPGSATGGLLMILAVSLVMSAAGMQGGETVFVAVGKIAAAAFCIQALSSMARYLHVSSLGRGARTAIIVVIAALCLSGGATYASIYGCASAFLGRKGVLRQHIDHKKD